MRTRHSGPRGFLHRFRVDLLVLLVSCAIFLPLVISPPHLMDDVDAVQAQIARNMLESGDWVTARLDGIAYLEKSPLIYWIMASSYRIFGVHDWAARLPLAFINIALCWVTARFAMWAFGRRAGIYSGTILATCIGMFLFTRILIPDAALTLTITVALWSLLRLMDESEPRPSLWFFLLYTSLACGLLLKGLIAAVFPVIIGAIYLAITREASVKTILKRLRPISGILLLLLIAAPWHILATLRNPPYFDWTMHSSPGEYHGFFWFYFLNEHLFRFLNMRYPRDYNTVPRLWFWLLHFVWLFPWSCNPDHRLQTKLPPHQSRRKGPFTSPDMDHLRPGLLQPVDNPGVLLTPHLSSARDSAGQRSRPSRELSPRRTHRAHLHPQPLPRRDHLPSRKQREVPNPRRHLLRPHAKPRHVHALARAHERSHAAGLRLSPPAPRSRRIRPTNRSSRADPHTQNHNNRRGPRRDDGRLHTSSPPGANHLRSLPQLKTTGRCAHPLRARNA